MLAHQTPAYLCVEIKVHAGSSDGEELVPYLVFTFSMGDVKQQGQISHRRTQAPQGVEPRHTLSIAIYVPLRPLADKHWICGFQSSKPMHERNGLVPLTHRLTLRRTAGLM